MRECQHIMLDGYPCHQEATIKVGKRWLCEDHADVDDGDIDPMMYEEDESIDDFDYLLDMEEGSID